MTQDIIINKYDKEQIIFQDEIIVQELRANLYINGEFYMSIMCMPKYFDELAIGFLFAEGLIKKYEDIDRISSTCTGNIFVFTHEPIDTTRSEKRVLISGCANGSVNLAFLNESNLTEITEPSKITPEQIIEHMQRFAKQSQVFRDTGAVHSSALVFPDGTSIFYEDIGRHNAVDKVIGTAIMQNVDIRQGALLISGRISSEIALKTAKLGIPILISQAAPTSMSVAIARKVNLTLVGFARGKRFNVYSGGERIGITD